MVAGWVSILLFASGFLSNFASSPDNGYYERRRPKANVGVHSCITTTLKASSTSSELLSSVILWICKNHIFSNMKMILSSDDTCYFVFHGSVA